ncbi:hypothetical protein PoB_000417600 [Plakobranchus ocellatus]|uniref:Uncharacterized protein n=1 Tax=Plakobranchus ocellatus TaxID=259542 RepID=A0AAV3Y390_9GAST|nr:hypothetical protein PoB_000417600 [Plakobranchus ocellatus]
MEEEKVALETNTAVECGTTENDKTQNLTGLEENDRSQSKTEESVNKIEGKEFQDGQNKSASALELGFESVSDTRSDEDPTEEVEEEVEYYESISEEEPEAAGDVDDISSAEDESFADTVATYSFTDLPFVPKSEFSSELRDTVKEKKFDSEENNFNRKPFSSAVSTVGEKHPSEFVHNADFSVPPPNFHYFTNENRPVDFSNYGYGQPGYSAEQNGQQTWHTDQANNLQANFAYNQQYYGQAGYQNYSQAAYPNYSQAGYGAQQSYSEPSIGFQSQADHNISQPQVSLQTGHEQVYGGQSFPFAAQGGSTSSEVASWNTNSGVLAKSDKSVFNSVGVDSALKKDIPSNSVKISEDQTSDKIVNSEEAAGETKVSSGATKNLSSAADWFDENGDPVQGAFDFVASEDTAASVDNKSSKVEYVFSVRNPKSVKDSSCTSVTDSGVLDNSGTVGNKHLVTGKTTLSLSEQIAAERAKVSEKVITGDEEKKLYEASKSREEYKEALQAALATTALAKVTPSTSKLLAENAATQKERISRFKRNQFTNQKPEVQADPVLTAIQPQKTQEEVALESQAITEILKEVQHGAARAKQYGALAWQKSRVPVVNKTFLHNTLVSTLREPYRPPGKRGGRATQGLHDRGDDSRSSSSSRSSRSYSSRSSSRSSYSSNSDRSRSRDDHGPRGYYDEAWAAYAAHYGYPWMGPEAYAMYYGPEGWPMEAYDAMYYGNPQAWADYEAFYGPQNFNPRARGRGFRGRGRDRGRGMEFRGRGRGWDMEFRGRGRGMEFRGGPPRGFPFPQQFRGMGPRESRSRQFSRSRSRSRESVSDREFREGVNYERKSRDHSRAGSRKSQSRSRSRSPVAGKHSRDSKSRSLSKDGREGKPGNESNDKSKKKKKKKKKHRKSKKSKGKEKDGSSNDQSSKQEEKDSNVNEDSSQKAARDKEFEEVEEGKSKSKKSKKHSKHKSRGEDTKRKDISEDGKSEEKTSDGTDSQTGVSLHGNKERRKKEKEKSSKIKGGEVKDFREKDMGSKKSESRSREQSRAASEEAYGKHARKLSKDNEIKGKLSSRSDKGFDVDRTKTSYGGREEGFQSDKYHDEESFRKHIKGRQRKKDDVEESRQRKDGRDRDSREKLGEAVENDLRLKLKAKRQRSLLQDAGQNSSALNKESGFFDSPREKITDLDNPETSLGQPPSLPGSGKKKVVKKKIVKKKKKDGVQQELTDESNPAASDGKPKVKRIVKRKIIVKRKKVKAGESVPGADSVKDSTGEGQTRPDAEGQDGTKIVSEEVGDVTCGKRKRIVKRKIIVKRKKLKVSRDTEETATAGDITAVSVCDEPVEAESKSEHHVQSGEKPAS